MQICELIDDYLNELRFVTRSVPTMRRCRQMQPSLSQIADCDTEAEKDDA